MGGRVLRMGVGENDFWLGCQCLSQVGISCLIMLLSFVLFQVVQVLIYKGFLLVQQFKGVFEYSICSQDGLIGLGDVCFQVGRGEFVGVLYLNWVVMVWGESQYVIVLWCGDWLVVQQDLIGNFGKGMQCGFILIDNWGIIDVVICSDYWLAIFGQQQFIEWGVRQYDVDLI